MTDKEKFIAKKKKELENICKQQIFLAKKGAKLALKKYKTQPAQFRKLSKLIIIAAQLKTLEYKKLQIVSQPFPRFAKGGHASGVVGDTQNCEIGVMFHSPWHVKNKCE